MKSIFILTLLSLATVSFCVPAGLAGGLETVNPADYTTQAWKSVPQLNSQNNGANYLVPVKVQKAQVQVVAGTNTVLEVVVSESSCSKSQNVAQVTAANCPAKAGGKQQLYKVQIWEKPWENFEEVTVEKIKDL